MANSYQTLQVRVARIERATPLIKRFTLAAADGGPLPPFTGGSHVIVQMQDGARRYSNAYSLMGSPDELGHYQIGVRREEASKGGSAFLHDKVAEGDGLAITTPNNLFALSAQASHHVLVAGGIGITPFLSQMHELRKRGASHELHYAYRAEEHGAFRDEIVAQSRQAGAGTARFYVDSLGQKLDLDGLARGLQAGAHIYVCGPAPLIDAVRAAAQAAGIAPERVHWEQFAAPPQAGDAFSVVLARSGRTVEVAPGESILKAIERDNAAEVECLCREGVCGTCETRILDGEAEHFDQYLSEAEKRAQRSLMICVSRAKGQRIVLDL
ncbi:ferredoxin--NADP(+) reductase [Cupriavidus sp. USMAA2-4]|uniref:PDR/VanB family oxidoreductase n=1 Tax=unclassified Cupriavidus TaxID=2640874 RepID=UPI0008A6C3BA|nr:MULTISPECIES: PDR/VanB family oxidoreductase [unclassified Cupriavidus]AOY95866.1 ferredoxin--NADP(+) reductase [Cupriavidus sp. USMAA2-4]AOZ03619.1 ferredoxin--NADP(+) reductase [Cupriavidus sp. USMAHM13]